MFLKVYKLVYTSEARSQIHGLGHKIQSQIKKALERLAQDPSQGKRLTGDLDPLWSYRSGDYRIIYQVFHKDVLVVIVAVGNRKDVYKRL